MGFNLGAGDRVANPVTVLANVSGQGAGTVLSSSDSDVGMAANVAVMIDLTAGTTPSLTASVQWSYDGASWFDADPPDSMTAIAAVGKKAKTFVRKAPFHRVSSVITGSGLAYTIRSWIFG